MTFFVTKETSCPLCNNSVTVCNILSTNSFGGQDSDFRSHPVGADPLHFAIAMCKACGYSDYGNHFSERQLSDELKQRIRAALIPFAIDKRDALYSTNAAKYFWNLQSEKKKQRATEVLNRVTSNKRDTVKTDRGTKPDWLLEAQTSASDKNGTLNTDKGTNLERLVDDQMSASEIRDTCNTDTEPWDFFRTVFIASDAYTNAALIATLRGAPAKEIAHLYLRAAWCCTDKQDIEGERTSRKAAIKYFERALENNEVDAQQKPVITYLVGELCRRIGDASAARTWFDKVLSWTDLDEELAWLSRIAKQQRDNPQPHFPRP